MSTNNLHNVDEILRRLMYAKKFTTYQQVADFLGVDNKALSAWKSRNSNIAVQKISAKCRDLDLNWLLTGEGEVARPGSVLEDQSLYDLRDPQILEMVSIMKYLDQVAKDDLLRQARKDLELMLMKQKDQVKAGLIDALEQCTARLPKPPDLSSEPTAEKKTSKVTSIISSESIEKLP